MSTCRARIALSLSALCVAALMMLASSSTRGDSLALANRRILGASVHVITADLNDPRIRIDIGLAAKGLSHSESFTNMVKRRSPIAAVTGTYFDTRSLLPVGTIIIGGKRVHVNYIGTAVCFMPGNKIAFVDTAKGERCELPGVDCGVRTGPRLLAGGHYVLNPRREGFRYRGLFGQKRRVAMGLTRHNKLLLVVVRTPVTFGKLASIMKRLGSVDAVCLDGGSSSAMFFKGKLVCAPGRPLTNIIEVHKSPVYAESKPEHAVEVVAAGRSALAGTTAISATGTGSTLQFLTHADDGASPEAAPANLETFSMLPQPFFSHLTRDGLFGYSVYERKSRRGRPPLFRAGELA